MSTRVRKPPRVTSGPSDVTEHDTGLTLRVVWPVVDPAVFDREAMREASRQWPGFLERHQVRAVGGPRMRVVETDEYQRAAFGADRAVVCVAAVVRRPPHVGVAE